MPLALRNCTVSENDNQCNRPKNFPRRNQFHPLLGGEGRGEGEHYSDSSEQ